MILKFLLLGPGIHFDFDHLVEAENKLGTVCILGTWSVRGGSQAPASCLVQSDKGHLLVYSTFFMTTSTPCLPAPCCICAQEQGSWNRT